MIFGFKIKEDQIKYKYLGVNHIIQNNIYFLKIDHKFNILNLLDENASKFMIWENL